MTPQITGKSWAMVILMGVIWGSTFLVIELALVGITPFWLAAARITFAGLLTSIVWGMTGWRLFTGPERAWLPLLSVSMLSTAIPFQLLSWGLQYVTSGFAGISMATVALMVLPLAHVLVPGEKMTFRRLVGFLIGFVGVVVLIGPDSFASSGQSLEMFGKLACLGAAACYAMSSITMRRLPPIDPFGLSAIVLLIGSVFVIATAYMVEGPPPVIDNQTLFYVALLGLVPTAGANILRVLVIRTAGPVFMSLVNYQVPLWSVFFGMTILNEPARDNLFLALVLILAGLGLSQYGALKRLFTGATP